MVQLRLSAICMATMFLLSLNSCKKDEPDETENPDETVEVIAAFSADVTDIIFGEEVSFTDESTGNPTTWSWTFEGGTPGTSSEQNPTVVYEEPGTFGVTLSVSNDESDNSTLKSGYITVGGPQIFTEYKFDTYEKTEDIVYGVNQSQHVLTVYEPEGDPRDNRPLIILAGGGNFQGSDLSLLEPFAEEMTKYGVVVAAAKFRNGAVSPSIEYQKMLIYGMQDTKAMVRYFKEKAHVWKIDTNAIFNGGYGTGAIISLEAAYWDEDELDANAVAYINGLGGMEGEQGHPNHSSSTAGIVSLAGGMYGSIQFIDGDDVPIFAIHGTMDFDVPYDTSTTSGGTTFYGSLPITMKADSVGLANELYTIQNGFHDAPPEKVGDYSDRLAEFIQSIIQ